MQIQFLKITSCFWLRGKTFMTFQKVKWRRVLCPCVILITISNHISVTLLTLLSREYQPAKVVPVKCRSDYYIEQVRRIKALQHQTAVIPKHLEGFIWLEISTLYAINDDRRGVVQLTTWWAFIRYKSYYETFNLLCQITKWLLWTTSGWRCCWATRIHRPKKGVSERKSSVKSGARRERDRAPNWYSRRAQLSFILDAYIATVSTGKGGNNRTAFISESTAYVLLATMK